MLDTKAKRRVFALFLVFSSIVTVELWATSLAIDLLIRIFLFALLGTAYNLMAGYVGLFSFGHAAYFGLGAYAGAYFLVVHDLSPWVGMLAGMILGGSYAAFAAALSFRFKLEKAYFVLTTFAFAELLHAVAEKSPIINSAYGFRVPIREDSSLWYLQFSPQSSKYLYTIVAMYVVALVLARQIFVSRTGYRLIAIRESEAAALSLGINAVKHKVAIVALSGALTAAGGTFYFQYIFFIDPTLAFGSAISIAILVPAIVGGLGTLMGPLFGSVALISLSQFTSWIVRNPPTLFAFLDSRSGIDQVLFGCLIVIVVIFFPKGIYGSASAWLDTRRSTKANVQQLENV